MDPLMDLTHVDILKEKQQKGIDLCDDKMVQCDRFLKEYEQLKDRLLTFPDKLSYDVTVPFGSQAFCKGEIVHTNEVTVLLGDDWFAKVSTKQATAIAERRIQQCVDMKEKMVKEKDQYLNWNKYIDDLSNHEDLVEIVEEYSEEEYKKWRLQHAINVREYHQKQRQWRERSNSGGSTGSNGSSDGESKLRLDCNGGGIRAEPDGAEYGSSYDSQDGKRHVRWMDLSKQNVKRITFKHTKDHTKNRHHHNHALHVDEGEEEACHQKLQSPSDIYRQFGAFLQSSPPKSILKVKHSPSSESDEPFRFEPPPEQPEEEENDDREGVGAFTGEVREISSPIRIEQRSRPRPTSHFKSSRKNQKRK